MSIPSTLHTCSPQVKAALQGRESVSCIMQVGPRLSFQSAWSTNAVSICRSCGLGVIPRLEVSRRFLLRSSKQLPADTVAIFAAMVRPHLDLISHNKAALRERHGCLLLPTKRSSSLATCPRWNP